MALVASLHITPGMELTTSYNMAQHPIHNNVCACGAAVCQGFMGSMQWSTLVKKKSTSAPCVSALLVAASRLRALESPSQAHSETNKLGRLWGFPPL